MVEHLTPAATAPSAPAPPAWTVFLAEAAVVALLMMAIGTGVLVLEHPSSWLREACEAAWGRRLAMGTGVGLVVVLLTYCPWGQLSGAHLNPAVTLALAWSARLPWPRVWVYVLAQVVGAVAGMALLTVVAGRLLAHPTIGFATTTFSPEDWLAAFAAEAAVTFVLMNLILACGRSRRLEPWTGVVAGAAMVIFVLVVAPVSGVSMNPARSLASALFAGQLEQLWLYVLAPPLGTLGAAQLHRQLRLASPRGFEPLSPP